MKHSIKNIFNNISMLWILITFIVSLNTLGILEEGFSFKKINNLNNQKELIVALIKLDKKDVAFAQLEFNGKITTLLNEVAKLRNLYTYDFTGHYIIDNSTEYLSDLDKLDKLLTLFNEKATNYYTKDVENEKMKFQELKHAFETLDNHINSIIFQNIMYEEIKFHIFEKLSVLTFILIFFTTLWYRKKLNMIYEDIFSLFSITKETTNHKIFSQEADAIALRMKRKPTLTDDQSLLDHETEIYNLKGLYNSYAGKMNLKDGNFTSVTVLEIDDFFEENKKITQELANTILKKMAFTLSLHEQSADVIARTGYNQFTIIFSRITKEEALKEIETIRENISEVKYMTNDKKKLQLSVSAGLFIKTRNSSLEEAMKEAKRILEHTQKSGKNKIGTVSDLIKG